MTPSVRTVCFGPAIMPPLCWETCEGKILQRSLRAKKQDSFGNRSRRAAVSADILSRIYAAEGARLQATNVMGAGTIGIRSSMS